MIRNLRATGRLIRILWVSLAGIIEWFACCGRRATAREKVLWMQRMSRRFLKAIRCEVAVRGTPPESGMLVCNHIGFVDILVIGSTVPCLFVAKSDVKSWPVFGMLTRLAGTIFVSRRRQPALAAEMGELRKALRCGLPVVVFPEGTSSDGRSVLQFRSSLLGAVEGTSQAITPAAISYSSEAAGYWGDMVFVFQLWRMVCEPGFSAGLVFGEPLPDPGDRKRTARSLQAAVVALHRSPFTTEK